MPNAYSNSFSNDHRMSRRGPLGAWQDAATKSKTVDEEGEDPHYGSMSNSNDPSRQEVQALLAASEARVATVVEGLRADAAELRSDLRDGLAQIKGAGEVAQVNADRFYAEARTMLADSRAALTEIKLAGEQNRTNVMAMGYKALTWLFGAILALSGLYFTIKKAVTPDPASAVAVAAPVPVAAPIASDQTTASQPATASPQPVPTAKRN